MNRNYSLAKKYWGPLLMVLMLTSCGGGSSGGAAQSSVISNSSLAVSSSAVSSAVTSSVASVDSSSNESSSSGNISSSGNSSLQNTSASSSSVTASQMSSEQEASSLGSSSNSNHSAASTSSASSVSSATTFARVSNQSCLAPDRPAAGLGGYEFEPVSIGNLSSPIFLAQPPGSDRYYVLEREGRVKTFMLGDDDEAIQVIDFSDEVALGNTTWGAEGGALGMAFHPNFEQNRYVYIFLTVHPQSLGGTMISTLRRYTVAADGLSFSDPVPILAPDARLRHTTLYHKGGWIGFSPTDNNNYLYIATGDSDADPGADPINNDFPHPASNPNSLHGKILRIDVDNGSPYGIPPDNPYANGGGAPEVFALGFRNPWRASFDRDTGDLWVGDVGENSREEISRVELGGNYGWPFREGHLDRCNGCQAGVVSIPPVVDMPLQSGARVAIVGGYVYRGSEMPELQGRYIFADYNYQGASTLSFDNNGEATVVDLFNLGEGTISLSEDNAGNIWRISRANALSRLTSSAPPPVSQEFPARLSDTGCVDLGNPRIPAPGVVPYDLNSPLWSDGADKERAFAIPDGSTIAILENGDWEFPIGSVLIKTFLLQGEPVETRLLVLHEDGDWGGYSYEWDGDDAYLLPVDKAKPVAGQTWRYPSRAQCMGCHTAPQGENLAAERALGLDTGQLNREFTYPGGYHANQIEALYNAGYFSSNPGVSGDLFRLPNPHEGDDLQARARSYLHTNCAHCHQPGGSGRGNMDFRYHTDVAAANYCNLTPGLGDLGIAGALLLKPDHPQESIIPLRMARTDGNRMPPLGVALPDTEGIAVIEAWINGLTSCP